MHLLPGEPEEPPSCHTATTTLLTKPHLPINSHLPVAGQGLGALTARLERFPVGPQTRAFRKRYFPEIDLLQWNDWRWQARARIRTLAELERVFVLSEDERDAVIRHEGSLPLGITPYYASLMSRDDAFEPLRRTHIPVGTEYLKTPGEADDPLGEDGHSVVPGLVHRYPDRVLFLATGFCSTYCRYCTRSRMVGDPGATIPLAGRNGSKRSTTSPPIPRSVTCCCPAAIRSHCRTSASTICLGGFGPSAMSSSCVSAPRCRWCCRSALRAH